MKRSSVAWVLLGLGCLFVLVLFGGAVLFVGLSSSDGSEATFALGSRVGIVDLEGVIHSAERMRYTLEKFRKAPNVKAVVVRINSPGGGVAASQEIAREIARFRKDTKKPVVASMES